MRSVSNFIFVAAELIEPPPPGGEEGAPHANDQSRLGGRLTCGRQLPPENTEQKIPQNSPFCGKSAVLTAS